MKQSGYAIWQDINRSRWKKISLNPCIKATIQAKIWYIVNKGQWNYLSICMHTSPRIVLKVLQWEYNKTRAGCCRLCWPVTTDSWSATTGNISTWSVIIIVVQTSLIFQTCHIPWPCRIMFNILEDCLRALETIGLPIQINTSDPSRIMRETSRIFSREARLYITEILFGKKWTERQRQLSWLRRLTSRALWLS